MQTANSRSLLEKLGGLSPTPTSIKIPKKLESFVQQVWGPR